MRALVFILAGLVSSCSSSRNGEPTQPPSEPRPSEAPEQLADDDDRAPQGGPERVQLDGADLARYDGKRITIEGGLFISEDGTTRLCSAFDESYPPQCGGTSVKLSGADSTKVTLEGEPEHKVRWSAKSVVVTGILRGDTLEVETLSESP
jgi:hypothetical protein